VTESADAFGAVDDLPVVGWTIPLHVANDLNGEFGTRFVGRDASKSEGGPGMSGWLSIDPD